MFTLKLQRFCFSLLILAHHTTLTASNISISVFFWLLVRFSPYFIIFSHLRSESNARVLIYRWCDFTSVMCTLRFLSSWNMASLDEFIFRERIITKSRKTSLVDSKTSPAKSLHKSILKCFSFVSEKFQDSHQ